MRQIILDTETTGLEVEQGHRIIEIGAIEMVNRRMTQNRFHNYFNPQRDIDEAAIEVHGISNDQLADEPDFSDLADELIDFLSGAELIIHNAPFDLAFLNNEFSLAGRGQDFIEQRCTVLDTLVMAKNKHPGQRNSLDALCKRYGVDNSQRTLHGALLDAEILADVYLQLTGGQASLLGASEDLIGGSSGQPEADIDPSLVESMTHVQVPRADLDAHEKWLELLRETADGDVIWDRH